MARKLMGPERQLMVAAIEKSTKPGPKRDYLLFKYLCSPEFLARWRFLQEELVLPDKKTGRVGPWKMNRPQRIVEKKRMQMQRAGKPERYLTLKARKWGFSRYWLLSGIEAAVRNENWPGVIVADKDDSASKLLEDGKVAVARMKWKLPTKYANRKQLWFDEPLNSHLDIATAKPRDPCRGGIYRFCHCTEPQIWPGFLDRRIAIENAVPDEPGTLISYEGTGFGRNHWYDFFEDAVEGRIDWHAFFFPWHADAEFDYAMALLDGELEALVETLDEKEKWLIQDGALPEQLKWRRWKIRESFKRDPSAFCQEYPGEWREAFRASGRPVFNVEYVNRQLTRCCEPTWRGDILSDPLTHQGPVQMAANEAGPVQIWAHPDPKSRYVMAADTGHGVRGGDPSACYVMDIEKGQMVAAVHGIFEPRVFARHCVSLGHHYFDAIAWPEIEGPGVATLELFKEAAYPAIGMRPTFDSMGRIQGRKLGWSTNLKTRPILFNEIRGHLAHGEEGCQFYDAQLAEELLSMYMDDAERESCPKGKHDDRVIAWGILLVARKDLVSQGVLEDIEASRPKSAIERHWQEWEAIPDDKRWDQQEDEEVPWWEMAY